MTLMEITPLVFGEAVQASVGQTQAQPKFSATFLKRLVRGQQFSLANSSTEDFSVLLNSGIPIELGGTGPQNNWAPVTHKSSVSTGGPDSRSLGNGENLIMVWRKTGPNLMFAAQLNIQSISRLTSPLVLFFTANPPTSIHLYVLSGGSLINHSELPNVLTHIS